MKRIVTALLVMSSLGALQAKAKTKYICTINVMDDAMFTEEFKTREECRKYCRGIGTVCEETGEATVIDTTFVD